MRRIGTFKTSRHVKPETISEGTDWCVAIDPLMQEPQAMRVEEVPNGFAVRLAWSARSVCEIKAAQMAALRERAKRA